MTIVWNGLDAGLAAGFADLVTSVVDPLAATYTVQQGLRTIAQQNALYAEGRNAAGQIVDPSAVVTNAAGGQSAHNYGLAVDVYPIVNGAIDWGFDGGSPEPTPAAQPAWDALWSAVRASGNLVTGADFALASGYDPGHIEIANWRAYTNAPIPADVTAVTPSAPNGASGAGGASSPTSTDGDAPLDGPSAPASLETTVRNWFELDPGVAIGAAAIIGVVLLVSLRRYQQRQAARED